MDKISFENFVRDYQGTGNPNGIWYIGMEWGGHSEEWFEKGYTPEQYKSDKARGIFSQDPKVQSDEKNFFRILKYIIKELGFNNQRNIIEEEKKIYLRFLPNESELFWINTSLIPYTTRENQYRTEQYSKFKQYKRVFSGLDNCKNSDDVFQEYSSLMSKNFKNLLSNNPKFIFCVGRTTTKKRLFKLLGISEVDCEKSSLEISYRVGKSKRSWCEFYILKQYENRILCVIPFSNARWISPTEDVKKICDEYKRLLDFHEKAV